jgi:hypothetical protein
MVSFFVLIRLMRYPPFTKPGGWIVEHPTLYEKNKFFSRDDNLTSLLYKKPS